MRKPKISRFLSLMAIMLHLSNVFGENSAKLAEFKFWPNESLTIRNDEMGQLSLQVRSNETGLDFPLSLKFSAENPRNFYVKDDIIFVKNPTELLGNISIPIHATFLGRTKLDIRLSQSTDKMLAFDQFDIVILRSNRGVMLSNVFTGIIVIFVVVNTFLMGTQLDLNVIIQVIKKPFGPIIGFCCQFILMPLIAFGWAMLLLRDYPSLQLGYFAVGCAPGGGASNFWTILLDGNLDLSVTMTFFSNIAAMGMMPLWLYTLGRVFYGGQLNIPFPNIIGSLAGLLLPSIVGILVRRRWPAVAEKIGKILKYFTFSIIIVILIFGIYANFYIFKLMTWRTLVPGFLLPWTGYLLAYVIAWALKQEHKNCRTIAIETGIQNGGIPIVLLKFSLPEPDSDMTLVMPVSVMMFTNLPLYLMLLINTLRKRCGKKNEKEEEAKQGKTDQIQESSDNLAKAYSKFNGNQEFAVGYDNKGANLQDVKLKI